MRKPWTVAVLIVPLALLLATGACGDDSPTSPGGSNGNSAARLAISGPDTIAPGGQAQYTLTATSHGGAREGTVKPSWRSSNPAIATIDESGRATGQANGEAAITASFSGASSTKSIMVLPSGTFRLRGRVFDESSNQNLRADVRVRAASGIDMQTATSPSGDFLLYGVPADAELEVTSAGYSLYKEVLQLREHTTLQIRLKRDSSVPAAAGTYALTVNAASCANVTGRPQLRSDLRSRAYRAVITESGTNLTVVLSNADFFSRQGTTSNTFRAFLDRGVLRMYLYGPDNYYYDYYLPFYISDVIERLNDGTFLITAGSGALSATGDGLRTTLTGGLWHRETVPNGTILGMCTGQVSLDFVR